MEKIEYQRLYEREKFYWWNVGRRRILESALLRHSVFRDTPRQILDVGCGAGGNILFLGKSGDVTGLDVSSEALRFSLDKGFKNLVQGRAESLPFADGTFDVVSALDVIEHVEDDRRALEEMFRALKNGGTLLLTVPAHRWLWSRHDEALHHKRRYSETELEKKVSEAGFIIKEKSHFVIPSIPFLLVQKIARFVKKKLFPQQEEVIDTYDVILSSFLNTFFIWWLACERFLMRFISLPVGSSLVLIAIKEDTQHNNPKNTK